MKIKTAGPDRADLLLNAQLEMLIHEDTLLTKIVGAALMFLSGLEGAVLPPQAAGAADLLAHLIAEVPDNTICEALQLANSVR